MPQRLLQKVMASSVSGEVSWQGNGQEDGLSVVNSQRRHEETMQKPGQFSLTQVSEMKFGHTFDQTNGQ
jgi:hypothetical protein